VTVVARERGKNVNKKANTTELKFKATEIAYQLRVVIDQLWSTIALSLKLDPYWTPAIVFARQLFFCTFALT
jgi:hypothetical protein